MYDNQSQRRSKSRSRSHLSLVHVFHAIPHSGLSVGGPCTIPVASTGHHCRNGEVSSNSTTISVTRFTRPHKSSMRQYTTQILFIRTQPTRALTDSAGGYHLRSSEFQIRPLTSFPSNILHFPLIAPPGLRLCHYYHHLTKTT